MTDPMKNFEKIFKEIAAMADLIARDPAESSLLYDYRCMEIRLARLQGTWTLEEWDLMTLMSQTRENMTPCDLNRLRDFPTPLPRY